MPVRGALKAHWFQILLAIADRPLHGYGIRQEVDARTGGTIKLWPGLLYRSIKALKEQGWIREVDPPEDAPGDSRDRRYFGITPMGLGALADETDRLAAYVAAARDKDVPFRHA